MIRLTVPSLPFLAALLGLVLPRQAVRNGQPRQIPQLAFSSEFAGVDQGGNCKWEGRVEGGVDGRVMIALRQVESPLEASNPVWHVRSRWKVEAAPRSRSFDAELEGMVDWKTGSSQLSGTITSGWMKGAWVQEEARFVNGDPRGVLRIIPSLAVR